MILDSGTRKEFESGAVRDVQEGKGRCDLLPLDVIAELYNDDRFLDIYRFTRDGDIVHLYEVLFKTASKFGDPSSMVLEASIHFEEGCNKYGERNWETGINAKNYINSGVRHLLKWIRGDKDESHDRAFVWNMLCCIWTCKNKPELNDFRAKTIAKSLYDKGYRKQEWISVKDRLPEDFVSVLGYMTDAGEFPPVRECYKVGGAFFFPALGDRHPISHWMPLPEAPKGGEG